MGFDPADIERIKAAVPADHRPSPHAGGQLSSAFFQVDSLRESTALQGSEFERHQLGMAFLDNGDDEAANPNFLLTGAQAKVRAERIERQHRKERDEQRQFLADLHDVLDRRLAALNAELEAIDRRLEEIRQRREQIGETLEAMDEIARLKRTGKYDPTNPAHARLAEQAGLSSEDILRMDIAELAKRRADLSREDSDLDTEWNSRMKRRGEVVAERDDVAQAKKDIENADTEEARIKAERRAVSVLGAQQLGEAAYQTDMRHAKIIAADAVASTEAAPVKADSVVYTRAAVTGAGDSIKDGSVVGWELDDADPSKSVPAAPKPG